MLDITRDFLKEHYNIDDEMMKLLRRGYGRHQI